MTQTIFRHKGYEMRSHSEVMWARFMDALRVRWVYEPQVIDTRHGWYLPDFYLPACGMYVEVKGPWPDLAEVEKASDAEAKTGCPVVFAHGDVREKGSLWFKGVMTHFTNKGAASLSMSEVCALVRLHDGEGQHGRVMRSRSIDRFDGVRMVGDILSEIIDGWMGRGDLETSKRRLHSPLNRQTEESHAQASIAEHFASEFVRRVRAGQKKEAAA